MDEDEIRKTWEGVHVSGTQDRAYYYSTYNGTDKNPISEEKPKIMILGGDRTVSDRESSLTIAVYMRLKKLGFERRTATVTLKRYLQTMTHLINCILSRLHWKTY